MCAVRTGINNDEQWREFQEVGNSYLVGTVQITCMGRFGAKLDLDLKRIERTGFDGCSILAILGANAAKKDNKILQKRRQRSQDMRGSIEPKVRQRSLL